MIRRAKHTAPAVAPALLLGPAPSLQEQEAYPFR
jgi:hypothetical protein